MEKIKKYRHSGKVNREIFAEKPTKNAVTDSQIAEENFFLVVRRVEILEGRYHFTWKRNYCFVHILRRSAWGWGWL